LNRSCSHRLSHATVNTSSYTARSRLTLTDSIRPTGSPACELVTKETISDLRLVCGTQSLATVYQESRAFTTRHFSPAPSLMQPIDAVKFQLAHCCNCFYRATLCVSAVFPVARCPSVRLSVTLVDTA